MMCLRRVLIIGAGLSGCTAASKLADNGIEVLLVEKADEIGGRVRQYGCKAVTDKCENCGVCLACGLWDKILRNQNIRVFTSSEVKNVTGVPGDFSAAIKIANTVKYFDKIEAVVVSNGFESKTNGLSAHLHVEGDAGLITGSELEKMLLSRTRSKLFERAPKKVAFIQCFGSRDEKESGLYCSRVCCSYSTRAAKVLRSYYPECEIAFFYMELQSVKSGNYFAELREQEIEFIKCRPLKITGGKPATVEYDDPVEGISVRDFDLVILSEGIHAGVDNEQLSQSCGLEQNEHGFLCTIGSSPGVYVCGCARTPLKVEEAYADSVAVAGEILASNPKVGGTCHE